jgi:hypothetical protein
MEIERKQRHSSYQINCAGQINARWRQLDSDERMERAKGIEPSYAAWEAAVLPLNYARGGDAAVA